MGETQLKTGALCLWLAAAEAFRQATLGAAAVGLWLIRHFIAADVALETLGTAAALSAFHVFHTIYVVLEFFHYHREAVGFLQVCRCRLAVWNICPYNKGAR